MAAATVLASLPNKFGFGAVCVMSAYLYTYVHVYTRMYCGLSLVPCAPRLLPLYGLPLVARALCGATSPLLLSVPGVQSGPADGFPLSGCMAAVMAGLVENYFTDLYRALEPVCAVAGVAVLAWLVMVGLAYSD